MAVEIAALVAAARGVSELLEQSRPLVESIRDGWGGGNKAAKEELAKKLDQLQQNLRAAAELARMGEEYTRMHEEIRSLLWDCERAKAFLGENMSDCGDRSSPKYDSCWRVLDSIFESVGKKRDPVRRALDDRAQWYDREDKAQIEQRLTDFALMYERAAESVRMRAAVDARDRIATMIGYLDDVSGRLDDTMYDKILDALQKLGQ
jgi:hypothetical protein